VPATDAVLVLQLGRQRRQEPHIVDVAAVRGAGAAPVSPVPVDAVGVDDHEAVRVGDGVEARQPLLLGPRTAPAVEVQHQAGGMARRFMDQVGPRQPAELECRR